MAHLFEKIPQMSKTCGNPAASAGSCRMLQGGPSPDLCAAQQGYTHIASYL
jgi:hypothetical protein